MIHQRIRVAVNVTTPLQKLILRSFHDVYRAQHRHPVAVVVHAHERRRRLGWNRNNNNTINRCYCSSNIISNTKQTVVDEDELIPTISIQKPDIDTMSSKEMKLELQSYGINTGSMLEKKDFYTALQKLRISNNTDDVVLPVMNAVSAMQHEIKLYHQIDNTDQYLERKEIESEFLQICSTIKENIDSIQFHDTIRLTIRKPISSDDTTTSTSHSHDHKHKNYTEEDVEEESDKLFYHELIYDEMKNVCEQLSIQEMHKVLEQELFISPYQLLYKCIVIVRLDGIVLKTLPSTDTSIILTRKERVFPTYLWKSLNVQDIIMDAYLDPNDERKHMIQSNIDYDNHKSQNISRSVQIQNEMKNINPMTTMKSLYKELEDVWGISPRCIYIYIISVLRVLDIMREEKSKKFNFQDNEMLNSPKIQNIVNEVMANPKIDTILSKAIYQPNIRKMIIDYMHNPNEFRKNNNINEMNEIQSIFNNPDWINQLNEMNIVSKFQNHIHNHDDNDNAAADDDNNNNNKVTTAATDTSKKQ